LYVIFVLLYSSTDKAKLYSGSIHMKEIKEVQWSLISEPPEQYAVTDTHEKLVQGSREQ